MMKSCVLVTGGAGFIGKYTANLLIKKGYETIIVDRKDKPCDLFCKYYQLDVTDSSLEQVFVDNNIDFVIHLAALPSVSLSVQEPLKDCFDNYYATVNVCSLAKKYNVKKFVFSSTAAVYANPQYLPVDEEHPTKFLSPYAITKNASENFIKYSGLDYIIFRYSNVYGPGQDAQGEAGVVAKFFDLMNQNKQVEIHGDGEQYRDFINVQDVADVNVLAIEKEITNTIINVSTNTKTSINELYNLLKELLNYKLEPIYKPYRLGDIPKSILNNKKLIMLLGYIPKVDIKTGLNAMIREYEEIK